MLIGSWAHWIGHFGVACYLYFRTIPGNYHFIWKLIWQWACKQNSFPCKSLYTMTGFETEVKGNPEIAYWLDEHMPVEFVPYKCSSIFIIAQSWHVFLVCQEGTSGTTQTLASVVSGSSSSSSSSANTGVNKAIQALAHRYCVECKGTFDELSKITQVWNNLLSQHLLKKVTCHYITINYLLQQN